MKKQKTLFGLFILLSLCCAAMFTACDDFGGEDTDQSISGVYYRNGDASSGDFIRVNNDRTFSGSFEGEAFGGSYTYVDNLVVPDVQTGGANFELTFADGIFTIVTDEGGTYYFCLEGTTPPDDETQSYTVTFVADGKTVGVVSYNENDQNINEPAVPEKQHYTGSWEEFSLTGGNLTVRAIYTPIRYTITFVADGETVEEIPYTVQDKTITPPAVPEKQHYTGSWEEFSLSGGNLTVRAIYTPILYTITFVADGETVEEISYTVEDKTITPPAVPKKTDYVGEWEAYSLAYADQIVYAKYTYTNDSGLVFRLTREENAYTVEGSTGESSNVLIPEIYLNLPVIGIETRAFENNLLIQSVVISEGIKSIGANAFAGCSALTTVSIPDSVTTIGANAFDGCTTIESATMPTIAIGSIPKANLKTVVITSGESIGNDAFYGCLDLTGLTINNVTTIGNGAFWDCRGLTSLTINNVTTIGANAFQNCNSLPIVTINNVTTIGNCAFQHCTAITSVTIPDSVTSIGEGAFYNCHSLTSMAIGNGVTSIGDSAFKKCSGLTSITIPDSVTSIGNSAFFDCSNLTNVTIGNGVTTIGERAFEGCNAIESATLPTIAIEYIPKINLKTIVITSGESIGANAFWECRGLTSVTIGNGVALIGDAAFMGCSKLTSITIPDSIASIGDSAFSHCIDLTNVTIGNGLMSIGNNAFSGCSVLTSIKIPDSVTTIGNSAFFGCNGLTSVTIPDSVTTIGDTAFYNCSGLMSVTIHDSVTSIGVGTFAHCPNLSSFIVTEGNTKYHSDNNCIIETASKILIAGCKTSVIPADGSVTAIGDNAFWDCSGLASITIPGNVTSIGAEAFFGCSGLISVAIPDSVTSIGAEAFYGCSSLTSVTIGNGVTSIDVEIFGNCSNLTSIIVAEGNSMYHSDNNCIIETASKTLIAGCKTSVIPADGSVTSIGDQTFSWSSALTSITIPDSVTSIGSRAFYDCSGLIEIVYTGTKAQWFAIEKGGEWNKYSGEYTVTCTDGVLTKAESM